MKSLPPTSGVSASRAFLASLLTCLMLVTPLAPVGFASTNASRLSQSRSKSTNTQPPAPKVGTPAQTAQQKERPVTASIVAGDITATKTDAIANDTLGDGKAQAGDTINYTITVRNNSATDTATGVVLNDPIDVNTAIVNNSIHAQPQARNDAYTAVGNTLLEAGLAAPSGNPAVTSTVKLFDNDADATDPFALDSFQATSAQGGTVTVNADGSFTYLPAVGFTGTDTFTYTIRNTAATTPVLTDTATVTITVGNRVWYVNNAAAAGGDGRSNAPFQTLVPVNGAGGAGDSDSAGDYIYLFTGNASYTTGLTLETTQQFVGNGSALVVGGNTLRAAGTRPTLTNGAGNALTLATNTNTQGLNLSAASNAAVFGSALGGAVNLSDVGITTTGTGTGVSLTNQAGLFSFDGGLTGSSIAGNSSGTAVLISGGSGNTTFSGVPVSQNSGRAVDIQSRTGGTVTFNNGSTVTETNGSTDAIVLRNNTGGSVINFSNNVNLATLAGRGLYTDNSTGSFTLNMNAASNSISATGGAAIDVEDITADLDFVTLASTNSVAAGGSQGIRIFNITGSVTVATSTTVNNSAATGVGVQSSNATVAFATLNSAPAAGQIAVLIQTNSGTTSSTGGTVTATDAAAVNVLNSPLNMTLTSVSADNTGDSDNGVTLNGLTGTLTMNGGALVGGNAQAFLANAQNGNITYNGTISQANAFRVIEVTNKTGGTVAFGGAVSSTSGNGTGVFLNANGNTTINFTGGLALTTNANPAFTATGGGTVNVTQNNTSIINTLTTTTGIPLNVANTNIGASNLTFRSISSNGATNGILLNNTGAAGGLIVSGNGGTCTSAANCTGGTIQSATIGASLISTRGVSITRMLIQNTTRSGIEGTGVVNFSFTNGRIENSGTSQTAGSQDANIAFNDQTGTENNLSGVVTITGNTLTNAFYHGVDIFNFAGTISDANISDNVITSSTAVASSLGSGIRFVAFGSAGAVASITKATLNNNTINNFPSNVGLQVQCGNANSEAAPASICGTPGNATNIINITNNKINVPGLGSSVKTGNEGLIALVNGVGQGNFNISSNNIQQTLGTSLSHSAFGDANVTSTINNNTIVANNINAAQGIGVGTSTTATFATNTPVLTTSINGNNISQVDGNGILAVARDNATGMLNVAIKNNTVAAPLTGVRQGIRIDAGNSTGDNDVCLDISGNTSAPSVGQPAALGIGIRKQGTSTTVNAFGIEGMAATSSPGVEAYVNAQNPAGGGTLLISATSGFTNCSSAPAFSANVIVPTFRSDAEAVRNDAIENPVAAQPQAASVSQPATPQFVIAQPQLNAIKPASAQASVAKETPAQAEKSETPAVQTMGASAFPISIGTLAPGESVTIIFSVKIADVLAPNVTQISNQGQITGSNFAGTVLTDDPDVAGANNPTVTPILGLPSITINNASVAEPTAGNVPMPFTVALSHAYGAPVTVAYQTADGTATQPTDYDSTAGTLTFNVGDTFQTISVPVNADGEAGESNEDFTLTLSTPTNATINGAGIGTGTITTANPPGRVLISEVRTSGPGGAGDDFVELYNNQDVSQDISGWAIVKSGATCGATPVIVAVIPAATTIPARGHYLIVGPAYSLAATAPGNVTAVADIEADRNIGLFSTSNLLALSTTTREDAVGFDVNVGGNNCDLLREGASLLSASDSASQYSFARTLVTGLPKETNNNSADFLLVSTTPAVAVGSNLTPALGAPGPENLAAPIQRNAVIKSSLVDPTVAATAPPNRVRSGIIDPGGPNAFGTLSIQRKFTNTLGVPVTRLRFRVVDLTTINNRAPGSADLRVLSSTGVVRNSAGTIVRTVNGLTLEAPPQPNGGGLNSALTVVLPGGMLAPGSSIEVQFLLGVQEQGAFSFFVNVEALPGPAGAPGTILDGAATKGVTTGKQNATAPKEQQ